MRKILLFCISLYAGSSSAQDCTRELLASKPGTWKAGLKGSVNGIAPADLARERERMNAIHSMITTKYQPVGCQALYATSYGKNVSPGETYIADPYNYTLYILRYLCDQQKPDKSAYYVDVSTTTRVNIFANVADWLSTLFAANMPPDDFRGYLRMSKRPQQLDGFYYFGEEVVADNDQPVHKTREYKWMITYGDELPFSYVSRREYLEIQETRLEKGMLESPSEKEFLQSYVRNIQTSLKMTDKELDLPAICLMNDEQRFTKFVAEGTAGSFFAIRPNLSYYKKGLAKSTPQFFTVVFRLTSGYPVFEENISRLRKAVDFNALRSMLGK